jgi:hypothetical protein
MLKIQAICRWWPGKHERIRDEIDTPTFETQSEESGEPQAAPLPKWQWSLIENMWNDSARHLAAQGRSTATPDIHGANSQNGSSGRINPGKTPKPA